MHSKTSSVNVNRRFGAIVIPPEERGDGFGHAGQYTHLGAGPGQVPGRLSMAKSRPFRIETKEVVGKAIVAEDHVTVELDIPPILLREETSTILADVLKERKFREDEDGHLVRERGG